MISYPQTNQIINLNWDIWNITWQYSKACLLFVTDKNLHCRSPNYRLVCGQSSVAIITSPKPYVINAQKSYFSSRSTESRKMLGNFCAMFFCICFLFVCLFVCVFLQWYTCVTLFLYKWCLCDFFLLVWLVTEASDF